MDCLCRDLDLDQLIEDPSTRLPLDIAKLHIRSEGTLLFAQHEYSPVQIAISIHELSLVLEAHDSKCWITPNKLVGCYRCSTGAQFTFTCRSNLHTPLAKVECSDGTLFVAHCSPNGTENTVVLPFSNSDISTKCLVDCPSGETSFNLNGTLYFVPLRRQTGHQARTSDNGIPDPDGSRPWYNPFGDFRLLWFANNWPWLMAVFLASAFALYIFILLNPILRTYRLILRLAVTALLFPHFGSALNPDSSAQNPEFPPPTSGFLLIAYGTFLLLFCCLFVQYRHKIRPISQANRLPF
jgi:hypothetical protein